MLAYESHRFEITVLGSGTSTGVPVVGCSCHVCLNMSPKNQRMRSSVFVYDKKYDRRVLIDTTPDLRMQLLKNKITSVDYVFFTHAHADHCHGLDDLRPFFFRNKKAIKVWASPPHAKEIREKFYYMFRNTGYSGLIPTLEFLELDEFSKELEDPGFETASLPHGSTESSVFKLGSFLYATDFKIFSDSLIEKWKGSLELVIASAPTYKPHGTHSCVPETIELFEKLEVKQGYLTHLSHQIDHEAHSGNLPSGCAFAYDGLKVYCS